MLLLLLACKPDPDDTDKPGAEPPADLACTAALAPRISLVIGIDTTAPAAGSVYAEFHEEGAAPRRTPTRQVQAGDPVRLDLIANPPETDIGWSVVFTADDAAGGGAWACEGSTRTGLVPPELPGLVPVTDDPDARSPEGYMIGAFFGRDGGIMAFRRDGTPVWYVQETAGGSLDVHYDVGGDGIFYSVYADNEIGGPDGYIQQTRMNGEAVAQFPSPYAHHMFTQLPDGTLTFQQVDIRRYTPEGGQEEDWVGDAIAEIPPGGEAATVFSVWDVLTPSFNQHMNGPGLYPGRDWTHGNMVRYDPDTDQYLLSLAHAADILMIRRTGFSVAEIWGTDGLAAEPAFDHQHDPNWLPDGNLLMFMTSEERSGAVEYQRDGDTLSEVWRHGFDRQSVALGQARRLPNGNTFINYGSGQIMQEVGPDGAVYWEVESANPGMDSPFFGQFYLVNDLYTGM